jgi:tetratricopeptide (TPR) repeat protein
MRHKFAIILFLFIALPVAAQKYPERRHVRAGNRAYGRQEWVGAEAAYRRALEKNPESRSAQSNLGSALYRRGQWGEAGTAFEGVGAHYNQGNALFKEQKLQEALEAYKNAMRADPADQDAKFNYAYVKKLLEEQQGGGGEDEQPQDKQEQEQEQEQEQQEQDKQQEQQQNRQQNRQGMSREDAEAMLEAVQAQEARTQEKLDDARRMQAVGGAVKNW